jgi:hypothetical protein
MEEGHKLMVSENRALRRIFGPKREEKAGREIKLHEELHLISIMREN